MEQTKNRGGSTSFDEVWTILQAIARRQEETDRSLAEQKAETERVRAETERLRAENERRQAQETERVRAETERVRAATERLRIET